MKRVLLVIFLTPFLAQTACHPSLAAEGEVCAAGYLCAEGLACVPAVGAEYGYAATDAVCEQPRAVYTFLHVGERGENRRVDEALAMIDGSYRLPRMLDSEPDLDTLSHPMTTADGTPATCRDVLVPDAPERDCLVPDWQAYYGLGVTKYPRFIMFGLRMTGSLLYVEQYAPNNRLRERIAIRTGRSIGRISRAELDEVRRHARNTALALFDSFVAHGHVPFALPAMPECYTGTSGYQNPNVAWAPELGQWDPASGISASGALVTADDVPIDCTGALPYTYRDLRTSVWDRHASSYRAMTLTNGYYLFRGLLPPERKRAWLTAIRETGDALALPSSYEAGDNHGITQSAGLIQLARDFEGVDPAILPASVTRAWLELGRHRLNDLFVDTVFPDGVQVEQSPFYHNYQLVLLLQVLDWLDRVGIDLTAGIDPLYETSPEQIPPERRLDYDSVPPIPNDPDVNALNPSSTLDARFVLDTMVRASIHLGMPDGWVPMIGSSLPQQVRGYAEEVLGAYALHDTELARQLLFYRTAGAAGEAPPHHERVMVFADSGFVTLRSAFEPDFQKQTHIVFNAGLPYHGHSHADALALHLFGPDTTVDAAVGVPLLIDPGWFSYLDERRHYFESTLAHNTINIDGGNQCVRDARKKRADPYVDARLDSCAELAATSPVADGQPGAPVGQVVRGRTVRVDDGPLPWVYQSAMHGLYAGVTHRRGVALLGAEIVIVVDQVAGAEPRDISQTWHLAPQVPRLTRSPDAEAGTYHFLFPRGAADPEPLFSLHQPDPEGELEVRLHHGEAQRNGIPGLGWYSVSQDEKHPLQVVELRREGATDAVFVSVFLLGELAPETPRVTTRRDGPHDVAVTLTFEARPAITLQIEGLAAGAPAESVQLR